MSPFDFIILFFSFVYVIALTHLLFAWTRMIRYRRKLVFSWPHLLWMLAAVGYLTANWLSLWDFQTEGELNLGTIAAGFLFVIMNYFVCALVSPDFESGETFDMKEFHEREGPTYISATLALIVTAVIGNYLAGAALGVDNWSDENALVVATIILPVLALTIKREWVQIAAPAMLLATTIAYDFIYYARLAP